MTTNEHLEAILARCTELLAIAEKRTQGEWHYKGNLILSEDYIVSNPHETMTMPKDTQVANATFIAACPGTAEAGWRATIAAIDYWRKAKSLQWDDGSLNAIAEPIIAAWPPETLNLTNQ